MFFFSQCFAAIKQHSADTVSSERLEYADIVYVETIEILISRVIAVIDYPCKSIAYYSAKGHEVYVNALHDPDTLAVINIPESNAHEIIPYLNRIEKMLTEQGFKSRRAGEGDIKRILGVYFEQNVTTEKFEEFDGERWIILND